MTSQLADIFDGERDALEVVNGWLTCQPCYADAWLGAVGPYDQLSGYGKGWHFALSRVARADHDCAIRTVQPLQGCS